MIVNSNETKAVLTGNMEVTRGLNFSEQRDFWANH